LKYKLQKRKLTTVVSFWSEIGDYIIRTVCV